MKGHSTLVLCDVCRKAVPDASVKEVIYQAGKVRYRLELCSSCLDAEMKRHDGHRGVPGFRKRAALVFTVESSDALPGAAEIG
ncbi:MAG: hypothetical protein ACRDKB_13405 [Actinomycetota bacterium]